ncbi:MAG: GNAT family N-acetyltransferase [Candidatus Latescibacteria bacterium]|nr:GNAT family N-acetyltransferase [Candidatus Latescibacterota bacterium]
MSQFTTPRPARLNEYAEAMAFTDRVFRPGQKGRRIVESQYPHAYRETASYARRLLLMRDAAEGDRLVGCLGVHPMRLRLGAATITAGGIGVVGADPARRGEGIMTRLLKEALPRMREAGHAISILGGDRQRYGWFGWENGGVCRRYLLTRRMLGAPTAADRRLKLRRFDAEDGSMRRRLHRWALGRPHGVEHSVADVRPLYHREGRETWVVEDGKRFASVCLGGAARRNRPYERVDAAFGDTDMVASALRLVMARFRLTQLWAIAGPSAAEADLFEPWAASWQTQDDGMVRILDLPLLVEQLAPEIKCRQRLTGVSLPDLQVQIHDLQQTALLPGDGTTARRCVMTSVQAIQFFFGSRPLRQTALAQQVSRRVIDPWGTILPLPLHVPAVHHI